MKKLDNPTIEDFNKIFKVNVPLKDALRMDRTVLEGIYTIGYHYNKGGDPLRSLRYFRLLCMLDPLNPKYELALAMGLHHLKQFKEAAMMYLLTAIHDPLNPIPWFYLSDCYVKLEKFSEAFGALYVVIDLVNDYPINAEYQYLKARAELIVSDSEPEKLAQMSKEESPFWENEEEEEGG